MNEVRALRTSGRIGQRYRSLAALQEATQIARAEGFLDSVQQDLRTEAIAVMAIPVDARPHSLHQPYSMKTQVSANVLAGDSRLQYFAVYSSADGQAIVFRASDGQELFRAPVVARPRQAVQRVILSEDGRLLLVHDDVPPTSDLLGNVQVWDWQAGKLVFDSPWHVPRYLRVGASALSADGRLIAVADQKRTIHVFRLDTREEVESFPCIEGPIDLAFSPDGNYLACAGQGVENNAAVYELGSGFPLRTWTVPFSNNVVEIRLAWHPSSRFLACLNLEGRGASALYELTTGTRVAEFTNPPGMLHEAGFTEGGEIFYTRTHENLARLWDPWTGRLLLEIQQVRLFRGEHGLLRFQMDKYQLVPWELSLSHVLQTLPPQEVEATQRSTGWSQPQMQIGGDGRFLLMENGDNLLRVWDLQRSEAAGAISRPPESINTGGFKLHPSRDEILLTDGIQGVNAWKVDWKLGRLHSPRRFANNARSPDLPISRDGKVFVSRTRGSKWAVIRPEESGRPSREFPTDSVAVSGYGDRLGISHNGRWGVLGYLSSHRGEWSVVDTVTGEQLYKQTFSAKFAFDPLDRWLVLMGPTGFVFHDTQTWQVVRAIRPEEPSGTYKRISWTADGALMGMDIFPGQMELRESASNRMLARFIAPQSEPTFSLLSPAGDRLVAVGEQVHVWDLRRVRQELATLGLDWSAAELPPAAEESLPEPVSFELVPNFYFNDRRFGAMAISPDAGLLAVARENVVEVYETFRGNLVHYCVPAGGLIHDLEFSPDGKHIVGGCGDGNFGVCVWEAATGELMESFMGATKPVYHVKFHPQGQIVGGSGADGVVFLWSLETGKEVARVRDDEHPLTEDFAFSPDGTQLLVTGLGTVQLRSGDDWQERKVLGGFAGWGAADFSPNGEYLAAGDREKAYIWKVGDEPELVAALETPASWLRFTTDSQQLITAGRKAEGVKQSRAVYAWDLRNLERPRYMIPAGQSHVVGKFAWAVEQGVLALFYSSDGSIRLLAGSGRWLDFSVCLVLLF